MSNRVVRWGVLCFAMNSLVACTLEPAYHRPELPVQAAWPTAATSESGSPGSSGATPEHPPAAADVGWREFFTDPALQRLIEIALANNRDARIAAINVAAARAQYRIQRAELFPSINATGSETAERVPGSVESAQLGGGAAGAAVASGGGTVIRYFGADLGFTQYELDVFGRLRSLDHEKLEQYFGYVETRRSTVISLVAEVANAYLTVLADQALLDVTRDTYANQRDSFNITQQSFDQGVSTELDLRQAETSVDTARANLALYTRQLAQDRNALVVLLGAPIPDELPAGGSIDGERLVEDLPAGLPSDVLTRRPDILSAERTLRAANANIGAARAAFFPTISLTGNIGSQSSDLSGLFKSGSKSWSFQPQISIPIFAGGANLGNLDLAKIQKNLYIAQYEQSIQTAFREVSDALVGRATLDEQLSAQSALKSATEDAYRLSDLRFRNGVANYLTVLDSQRSYYSAQQTLINVKLSRLQNLVTLYKALGGGWQEHSDSVGTPQATVQLYPDTPRTR